MNLTEKLQYHINKLQEASSIAFTFHRSGYRLNDTIVYKDLSANEMMSFMKDKVEDGGWKEEGCRALFYKGHWYMWNALGELHDTVAKRLGMTNVIDIIGSSVEIQPPNKLGNDFWDRTSELDSEMTDPKERRLYAARLYATLKSLEKTYHTKMGDYKKVIYRFLNPIQDEYQPDPARYMNRKDYSAYRKTRRDNWAQDDFDIKF